MQLPITQLETADLGQGNPTPLNNANWRLLEALSYVTSRFVKTTTIDGKTLATTSLANASGYKMLVTRLLIVPVTLTAVTASPQLEIGEDVSGTNSLMAAATPTLVAAQIQEMALLTPRPAILNGGSLKVKVDTVATGTTYQFQVWAEVLLQ